MVLLEKGIRRKLYGRLTSGWVFALKLAGKKSLKLAEN